MQLPGMLINLLSKKIGSKAFGSVTEAHLITARKINSWGQQRELRPGL
jgi:hypothetical protein